jgi:hypothetical protein
VTWVILNSGVAHALEKQLGAEAAPQDAIEFSVSDRATTTAISEPSRPSATTRKIRVTAGGLRHGYIRLPLSFFPLDSVGGGSKEEQAESLLTISFSSGETTKTDIDGTKCILRARGPVRGFLIKVGLKEGDNVLFEKTGTYEYRLSKG